MSLNVLKVSNGTPIYLPYDTVQVAFGEPFTDVTFTVASPGVFTVPGYVPTNGDQVSFSVSAGGAVPTGITAGTVYFVVAASGDTFEVATTAGGTPITLSATGSGTLTLHLYTQGATPVNLPFKPLGTVLAVNFGASSAVLQSAPDVGGNFADPQGPGAWTTIATVGAGSIVAVQLNNDWLQVSTTSGVVYLIQV